MDDTLHGWLRLAHTPGIGPITANRLLDLFHDPEHLFSSSSDALQQAGIQPKLIARIRSPGDSHFQSLIRNVECWNDQPINHVLHRHDKRYPALLKQIPDAPVVLYVSGDPDVLSTPGVAIVGSRKSAAPALENTRSLARALAIRGITVTSGLALGIDQAAHQACVAVNGLTIAVAGTGLDRVYPARHRELAQKITESGALVSELALGSAPLAHHFPQRNRIISGLSLGVVVIEAAIKSGSLTTARQAMEHGREVMVVPGSINNPLSRGCNQLIRSGATLVQSCDDVLTEIATQIDIDPRITSGSVPNTGTETSTEGTEFQLLLDCLGFEPASVDTLVTRSGQAAGSVSTMLLKLELEGKIVSLTGGRYARC